MDVVTRKLVTEDRTWAQTYHFDSGRIRFDVSLDYSLDESVLIESWRRSEYAVVEDASGGRMMKREANSFTSLQVGGSAKSLSACRAACLPQAYISHYANYTYN